jgi:hypothetical protein
MNIQTLNQVGLEVATTAGERYGCKATAFEVHRRDADSLWFTVTFVSEHRTSITTFKMPLQLANGLTSAYQTQARRDLADILNRSSRNFSVKP